MRNSKHKLTYIEMYPEPLNREPSPFAVIGGAFVCAAVIYLLIFLAFSL